MLLISSYLVTAILNEVKCNLSMILIYISLHVNDGEQCFMYFFSSFKNFFPGLMIWFGYLNL